MLKGHERAITYLAFNADGEPSSRLHPDALRVRDATVRPLGVETGVCKHIINLDPAPAPLRWPRLTLTRDVVTSIRFNRDRTLFVTSSADKSVKLWDTRSLAELRVFNVDTMMNGCAISPIRPHVLMAGGQEARNVTTTAASAGRFETRIHHVVGGEELARIPGHFGTVNSIDVSPDGRSLATGGEDGYVRLNFLPPGYFRLGEDEDLRDPAVAVALEAFMHAAAEIVDDPTLPSVFDDEAATGGRIRRGRAGLRRGRRRVDRHRGCGRGRRGSLQQSG
ncbi:hypothetical protein FNF28_07579 [Cafeteria roenbergensis]|uniref:Serine-threonine kinase receptor-associated protein n=1 Tax=Cafeteria roenbergensis TaxID=33653 RepID=A0A5A8C305_CAFRO|nr:hypothetical protein FNF28_07579 [Cafeteria roenbergensis]